MKNSKKKSLYNTAWKTAYLYTLWFDITENTLSL